MNGRIGSDKNIGHITCVKSTGSSVVDYLLCKPELISRLTSFDILEQNILSDHCALTFSIDVFINNKNTIEARDATRTQRKMDYVYRWDNNKLDSFIIIQ